MWLFVEVMPRKNINRIPEKQVKGAEIRARVSNETKKQILYLARTREESESLIVREAIEQYLSSKLTDEA